MRVIAGDAKGRRLFCPHGQGTRPTTDRVREALFSMLGDKTLGAHVLDLFAGTGALGLEALSRGAASCVFVEKNIRPFMVLEKNVTTCGFKDRSRLMRTDAFHALDKLALDGAAFGLILLDPPYGFGLEERALVELHELDLISRDAVVCVETPSKAGSFDVFLKRDDKFSVVRNKSYGDTTVWLLAPSG